MTRPAAQRIGIFGGAFDPPHAAHVALAQAAVTQLHLDALRIIPTGQAWHKPRALTPALHRLAMARLAFAALSQAVVDNRETHRHGPSYTYETLRELHAESPASQWFLIIGADQARDLTTWQQWQEIVQSATICVADRPYLTGPDVLFDAEALYPDRFVHLQLPALDIDATAIRRALAAGQDVTALVGAGVARYIADHSLYQTAS